MKFGIKLALFIITCIAIVLSCSRYYIVKNNTFYAIENISIKNTNQHSLEKRMIENFITQKILTRKANNR